MDKQTFTFLRLFELRNTLSISDISTISNIDYKYAADIISWLFDRSYIKKVYNNPIDINSKANSFTSKTKFEITNEGRLALKNECQLKRNYILNEVRAWITLTISVISFLLSLANLFIH